MKKLLPLREMAENCGLISKSLRPKRGRRPFFTPEGKVATRCSATEMEGSFGTQKEHYDLRRVKARTKKTEILYIFFGIHTANVV